MDQELIRAARRTDLAVFLTTHHPDAVKITGQCVYLRKHDSVYTRFGFCGYSRFSSTETGNSIDFLRRYLGYSFQDAVVALTDGGITVPEKPVQGMPEREGIKLPIPAQKPYKRAYAYLTQKRGIPPQVVNYLIQQELLYQEDVTGNAVFISRNKDFCELRGTSTYSSSPFHGIRRSRPDCYWSVENTAKPIEKAYICEGAIDAISLLLLFFKAGVRERTAYVAIGGVKNQQAIDKIRESVRNTILAVDNDAAGQECRDLNSNLDFILPTHKDWNEDLLCGSGFTPAEKRPDSKA